MERTGSLYNSTSRRRCDTSSRQSDARRFMRLTKPAPIGIVAIKKKKVASRMRLYTVASISLVFLILLAAQYGSSSNPISIYSWPEQSVHTVHTNGSTSSHGHDLNTYPSRDIVNHTHSELSLNKSSNIIQAQNHSSLSSSTASAHYSDSVAPKSARNNAEPVRQPEAKEKAEVYYHNNLVHGSRPICRIYGACLLSNGIYSLPWWMRKYRAELSRCGLAVSFQYHDSAFDLPYRRNLDADFVHTHQTVKFKEPPSHFAHFFPEVIMKASFLFEVLGGDDNKEHSTEHCHITKMGRYCSFTSPSHSSAFKPALFVPLDIQKKPQSWSSKALSFLERAYGSFTPLNMSDVLHSGYSHNPQNVSATCFRSIAVSFPVYRDIPPQLFAEQNRFFQQNGIDRTKKKNATSSKHNKSGFCEVSVGILDREGQRAMVDPEGLKRMIGHVIEATQTSIQVHTDIFKFDDGVSFEKQTQRMQTTDILLAAHGAALANIGFLRKESMIIEIFPFGWQPSIFSEMAHVFEEEYHSVPSIPQSGIFKECLEQARKIMMRRGVIPKDSTPVWLSRALRAWDAAVAEHIASGREKISFVDKNSRLSNFYTRSCARHQTLEFDYLKVARLVAQKALSMCKIGRLV